MGTLLLFGSNSLSAKNPKIGCANEKAITIVPRIWCAFASYPFLSTIIVIQPLKDAKTTSKFKSWWIRNQMGPMSFRYLATKIVMTKIIDHEPIISNLKFNPDYVLPMRSGRISKIACFTSSTEDCEGNSGHSIRLMIRKSIHLPVSEYKRNGARIKLEFLGRYLDWVSFTSLFPVLSERVKVKFLELPDSISSGTPIRFAPTKVGIEVPVARPRFTVVALPDSCFVKLLKTNFVQHKHKHLSSQKTRIQSQPIPLLVQTLKRLWSRYYNLRSWST